MGVHERGAFNDYVEKTGVKTILGKLLFLVTVVDYSKL